MLRRVGIAVGALIAVVASAVPAQALTPPEELDLTTVGADCYEFEGANRCVTLLVTRANFFVLPGETVRVSATLTGAQGPLPLSVKLDVWQNRVPATDYKGLAVVGRVSNDAATALAPGRYTYSITVGYPGQWTCSKFDRNGCTFQNSRGFAYSYVFNFDGVTAVMVPPVWEAKATKVVKSKTWSGKPTVELKYASNVPAGVRVLLQRKVGAAAFKTVARGLHFDDPIVDRNPPRSGTAQYRVSIDVNGGPVVTNAVKTRF